jgi:hypothetical protein
MPITSLGNLPSNLPKPNLYTARLSGTRCASTSHSGPASPCKAEINPFDSGLSHMFGKLHFLFHLSLKIQPILAKVKREEYKAR